METAVQDPTNTHEGLREPHIGTGAFETRQCEPGYRAEALPSDLGWKEKKAVVCEQLKNSPLPACGTLNVRRSTRKNGNGTYSARGPPQAHAEARNSRFYWRSSMYI